jgi:outer membrane lipoprotein-sorting protein
VRKVVSSILFFLLLFFLVSGVTPGQPQDEAKDLAAILDQFKKAQESIEDFTADIKQVKISSLLKEPAVSRGRMRFKRPNQVWLEMYSPYPNITALNEGVLLIYFPDEKVAQRYQVAGNPTLAKWLLFFQNPIETLGKKIRLQGRKSGEVVLGIDPAEDLAVFQEIRIAVDTSNWMPKRLEMVEKNGDRTTINYHNIMINSGIPAASFKLRLPPDVDIIEPMRR